MHIGNATVERGIARDDSQEDHGGLRSAGEGDIDVSQKHIGNKVKPLNPEGRAAETAEVRDDQPQR